MSATDVLQPGLGSIRSSNYLPADPGAVIWGRLPCETDSPVLTIDSGTDVTIDTISHEGIHEDQGRDPVRFFGSFGVERDDILQDAAALAASDYRRDPAVDGPHVVTGPIRVSGAMPGDLLKITVLETLPRVPYGIVANRHGRGALPGEYPLTGEIVSIFAGVDGDHGTMPRVLGGEHSVRFPLAPFLGIMGVAVRGDVRPHSVPPGPHGGNIDINLLTAGSTFYLPVFAEGALFYTGDPHMAMGNGEVALTAMEGSLRSTFRLTVCKRGSGDAPSVAFSYPFAETPDAWVPIGLSDPDGSQNGQINDLNIAMRRAVVNALDFLQNDHGMDRAVAYAYLSAAADFEVSQVVDRTTGVHGVIQKSHFAG